MCLEAVESLEKAECLSATPASRATIFGDWPQVLEALCEEGTDLDSIAHVISRVSLTRPDPRTLGAMVKRLGWQTTRRRRAVDHARVQVLVKGPTKGKDQ